MKFVRTILSTALCLLLLPGRGEKTEPSQQTAPVETAPAAAVTEPAEIPLVDCSKLPQGYELKKLDSGNLLILENGITIGGIDIYQLSEDIMHDLYYRWLENLGIPDYETEGLCRSGGSSLYGNWEMYFESDVPPGVESIVSRFHTFYVGKTIVWDVWFDMMVIDRATVGILLEALTVR